jgi:hypothetical protein
VSTTCTSRQLGTVVTAPVETGAISANRDLVAA